MLNFKDKKIVIMGLGLYGEGSGISATKFLIKRGAKVLVTDLKTKEQLKDQIKRLGASAKKIEFVLGGHREKDFKNADLIVRNPGVPKNSPYLKIARENNIPIENDISLFFQLVDRKRIIGITGTRGKSTTASLIYEIIKVVDKNAVLGGNITKSPLAQMSEVKKGGAVVLELSSWLIEELEGHHLSPHIAVVTNIYPDHLNTYDGINDYASAKENIWRWQTRQDYVILNRDNKYTLAMGGRVPSQRFWFSLKKFKEENGCFLDGKNIIFRRDGKETNIMAVKDIKIIGEHNLANVLSAVCVAMIFGVASTIIKRAVKNFKGIADRLEFLRAVGGIKYYNDTTSTTPEATIAALKALSCPPCPRGGGQRSGAKLAGGVGDFKKIVLIAGGADKGLEFNQLVKEIKKYCKSVVLLNGTGTQRILEKIKFAKVPMATVNSMTDAVGVARSFSKRGDIILLSPAFASFGIFINEFDRGEKFKKIISRLK